MGFNRKKLNHIHKSEYDKVAVLRDTEKNLETKINLLLNYLNKGTYDWLQDNTGIKGYLKKTYDIDYTEGLTYWWTELVYSSHKTMYNDLKIILTRESKFKDLGL